MDKSTYFELPELETNVDSAERVVSLIAGSILLLTSASKGGFLTGLAGGYLAYRGATGNCPARKLLQEGVGRKAQNIYIRSTVTVKKPRKDVYQFWKKLENLPLFMEHLEDVVRIDNKTSKWVAKLPHNVGTVSWKSEIVDDDENVRIGWQSLPGSTIENSGNIYFTDAGKYGTKVHAMISYNAPAGRVGSAIAEMLSPLFEEMVKEDVKNFKHFMETGSLPHDKKATSSKSA